MFQELRTNLRHRVVVDFDDLIQVLDNDAGNVLQLLEVELPVGRYESTERNWRQIANCNLRPYINNKVTNTPTATNNLVTLGNLADLFSLYNAPLCSDFALLRFTTTQAEKSFRVNILKAEKPRLTKN